MIKKTTLINIFLFITVLFFSVSVQGEIIFQDDFDDHSDWSPAQNAYPTTTANQAQDGTGIAMQ